jgi:hypothetical protein
MHPIKAVNAKTNTGEAARVIKVQLQLQSL